MKKFVIAPRIYSFLIVSLAIIGVVSSNVVWADDSPAMGGSNWNANDAEWQMDVSDGTNSEVWTFWLSGTDSGKTIGPGEEDFIEPAYQETGQTVYNGKVVMDKAALRQVQYTNVSFWSPMLTYFDRQTLEARETWQKSESMIGEVWTKLWNIDNLGTPTDKDLGGGETWSYNQTTDPAGAGWVNNFLLDTGNQDNEPYSITVSGTPQTVTVNGMTFSCYEIDRSGPRGYMYDYWDVDGALASSVKVVDEIHFDKTNIMTLKYHDWPGAPVVNVCDSGESTKSEFDPTDDVFITGHWVTLNPSLGDATPNEYDIWIGNGLPTEGDVLGTDWGADTGVDANVAPQAGANEPGTFFVDLGPAQDLPVTGMDIYFVLDEGDGEFHLDNQVFEGETDPWGSQAYYLGDTAYDDGLSSAFTITPSTQIIYVNAIASGSNNGTSWADAYINLRQALSNAGSPCEIWVASGTYTPAPPSQPGTRTDSFAMKNDVGIYGGFSGSEIARNERNWEKYKTVLSGEIGNPGTITDNCNFVINNKATLFMPDPQYPPLKSSAILDGFIIKDAKNGGLRNSGCHPYVTNCIFTENYGSGVLNLHSSPQVVDCLFHNNNANDGGGMCNISDFPGPSSPEVTRCIFKENTASRGGGMYNNEDSIPVITDCTFIGNQASDGGGLYSGASITLNDISFSENHAENRGGGIYCAMDATVELTSCMFDKNHAGIGGGVYNDSPGNQSFFDCTFMENQADNEGGGIYNFLGSVELESCDFIQNTATSGGGLYNSDSQPVLNGCNFIQNSTSGHGGAIFNDMSMPVLSDCSFIENSTASSGGGIYNGMSVPTISHCLFEDNNAFDSGGGIFNGFECNTIVSNSVFSANNANDRGGGIYTVDSYDRLINCLFVNNKANAYGGGIFTDCSVGFCSLDTINCTFWKNSALVSGGGVYCINTGWPAAWPDTYIDNSILWHNEPQEFVKSGTVFSAISYCDIEGGYPGIGNISGTPLFVNPGSSDFHLLPNSPCIDAGTNSVPNLPLEDFEGDDRIIHGTVDMGIDEHWSYALYDEDETGKIEYIEMVDALMDYLASQLRYRYMVDVLMCYLTG